MSSDQFNIPVVRFDARHLTPNGARRYVIRLHRDESAVVIAAYKSTTLDDQFVLYDAHVNEFLLCLRSGPSIASGVGARRATNKDIEELGILGR